MSVSIGRSDYLQRLAAFAFSRLTERHRSRTCLASGYDAVPVLKTGRGTGPGRSGEEPRSDRQAFVDPAAGQVEPERETGPVAVALEAAFDRRVLQSPART